MSDYVHWATLGALCEFLPLPENRVTLDGETGPERAQGGKFLLLPGRQRSAGQQAAQGVMDRDTAGCRGEEVITIDRYAHLVGGAGWPPTNDPGWSTRTADRSPCPICT